MNILKIKETCLYFKDLKKAKALYNDVLDLQIISYIEKRHIFFRAGSSVLLCFNPEDSKLKLNPPGHFGEGKLHFAFEVPRAEYLKTKEEIRAKGIAITKKVIWESGQESFCFEDLEGNVLEVVLTQVFGISPFLIAMLTGTALADTVLICNEFSFSVL